MPTLKLHYDGWLSLPSGLRQQLGLGSGDRLEADLVDGAIVLRPAAKTRRTARREREATSPRGADATETLPIGADAVPAKRKPGRPRKTADAGDPAPAPREARGRPRKTTTILEPEPAASPTVAIGPPKLLKKADLQQPKDTPADLTAPPPNAPRRARGDAGFQPVERRPFRNVEVRKLGPGRGHNRTRRQPSGTVGQSV